MVFCFFLNVTAAHFLLKRVTPKGQMIVLMNAADVTETLKCTLLMQNIDFLSTFHLSGIQIRSCTAFIIKQNKQFEADNAADDLCAVLCSLRGRTVARRAVSGGSVPSLSLRGALRLTEECLRHSQHTWSPLSLHFTGLHPLTGQPGNGPGSFIFPSL